MPEESAASLAILPAALAEDYRDGPYAVVIRTVEEFTRWLRDPPPGAEALHVEGLIRESDCWSLAAQGTTPIPIDVVLRDPATEFSALYRLVDVQNARDVRVTIPVAPGFLKALRLAVSLRLPVRLLPGQPDEASISALAEALEWYLHDPMVETPIEFFHSALAAMCGNEEGALWMFLEQDPAVFSTRDATGQPRQGADFVDAHWRGLVAAESECVTCRWQSLCHGYFKYPEPHYDCAGIKGVWATLEAAATEITRDLAAPPDTPAQPALTDPTLSHE